MASASTVCHDAIDRINTVQWVAHTSLMTMGRYRALLSDEVAFNTVFPGLDFANPKIDHTIEGHGELLEQQNYDLFKAWQILSAISNMTSVLDTYLRETAERVTGNKETGLGMLDRFKDITGIRVSEFPEFARLRHFYQLRHISLHNLGRVNQRFREKTSEPHHADGPYVYFPQQITEYRDLLVAFIGYIETKIPE
jgi:hypothetical protein